MKRGEKERDDDRENRGRREGEREGMIIGKIEEEERRGGVYKKEWVGRNGRRKESKIEAEEERGMKRVG